MKTLFFAAMLLLAGITHAHAYRIVTLQPAVEEPATTDPNTQAACTSGSGSHGCWAFCWDDTGHILDSCSVNTSNGGSGTCSTSGGTATCTLTANDN